MVSQEHFENEVNLVMRLEHPNIVRLVGYCYEIEHVRVPHERKFVFDRKTERLLCMEFLPNGSLDKYISEASYGLRWHTRYKIIEGISYGLQYLHEQLEGPVIHLDLKPANVLLDKNMLPKITDFSLSSLLERSQTIHTATITRTLGYMAPEYLHQGIITPVSDIFSLGVIIMEELQKWRNMLQKVPGYTSLEADCQHIKRCIQIGLMCVNPEWTKRPTMKKVIDMLEGLESMDWYISNEVTPVARV
ncbi:hypothetical protein CFC21_038726 [Triticum aestivum]|uniref:non-specific serine/threonine protein kinase n=2 Tax=Triticum aestivum TaxID=4565 RepID=A0A9R1JR39_WHEAT|nr:hypothetical protein CFC21_038724 [Triticum aestivum]KAF7026623.1 hypothetical protein CFC21_038726 [Triticum aestivum]CDM79995.1 unnamed protein product [Triticum aestivum]